MCPGATERKAQKAEEIGAFDFSVLPAPQTQKSSPGDCGSLKGRVGKIRTGRVTAPQGPAEGKDGAQPALPRDAHPPA